MMAILRPVGRMFERSKTWEGGSPRIDKVRKLWKLHPYILHPTAVPYQRYQVKLNIISAKAQYMRTSIVGWYWYWSIIQLFNCTNAPLALCTGLLQKLWIKIKFWILQRSRGLLPSWKV